MDILKKIDDKELVIQILSAAFKNDKSVNLVVGNDVKKIPELMAYSYELAKRKGKIFISNDRLAVALILFPKKRIWSVRMLYEHLKLAVKVIGISNVPKVLEHESAIKQIHPKKPYIHLWYIGVNPTHTGVGRGSSLLQKIIRYAQKKKMDIYLETSVLKNINFYETHGFENYSIIDSDIPFSLMLFRKVMYKKLS